MRVRVALQRLLAGTLRPRRTPSSGRTRLYGVGTGKTGTHSIAAMFRRGIRAEHEPGAAELIEKILARRAGRIDTLELRRWVVDRDTRFGLDVDSSPLNASILDLLVDAFPEARFVLTIRDPWSWLESRFNHELRFRDMEPHWRRMLDDRFQPARYTHQPGETVLARHGLYTLDGYLAHWAAHNAGVLAAVPADRLLVVRTPEIGARAAEIAAFAGLPPRSVHPGRAHAFRNPERRGLIRLIDPALLEDRVNQHCRPLLDAYFAGAGPPDRAGGPRSGPDRAATTS